MRSLLVFVLVSVLSPEGGQAQTKKIEAGDLQQVIGVGDKLEITSRNGRHAAATIQKIDRLTMFANVSITSSATEMPIGIVPINLNTLAEVKACKMIGRKRKILPIVLASTLSTISFLAAGASEEKKGKFLPVAAGITGCVTIGGP